MHKEKTNKREINLIFFFAAILLFLMAVLTSSAFWYQIFSNEYRPIGTFAWQIPALSVAFFLASFAFFEWANIFNHKKALYFLSILLFLAISGGLFLNMVDKNHTHPRRIVSFFVPQLSGDFLEGKVVGLKTVHRLDVVRDNGETVEVYIPQDSGKISGDLKVGNNARMYGLWVDGMFLARVAFVDQ